MSEPAPTPPPQAPSGATPSTSPAQPDAPTAPAGPTINIGEEYGTAKKNLPPAKIVLIAVGAVLVVVLIASFLKRAKPQGGWFSGQCGCSGDSRPELNYGCFDLHAA